MIRFKRQFFFCFSLFSAAIFLFSCSEIKDLKDLEIPESLSAKITNTTYNFPLGSGTCLIRDRISASELRKTFNENISDSESEVKVYDFAPEGADNDEQVLQYLIKYPIKDVPLTISTDGSNSMKISSKIPIKNLNSKISDSLAIEEQTYTITETGTDTTIPETDGISFNITSPDFDTMTVYNGSFNINVAAPGNVSSDFSLVAKVILCDSNGNEISESEETDITNGANLDLYLDGKTLVPNMKLKFSGTMSGGTLGNILSYTISMTTQNLKVQKVTGLNMTADEVGDLDNDESTPNGTVAFSDSFTFSGMNSSLVSAKVAKGSLDIYSEIPEGWSGVNATVSTISVSQTDGISLAEDDFKDVSNSEGNYLFNKTADIAGQTIKPSSSGGEIEMAGLVSVSFSEATIIFDGGTENPEIEVLGNCAIDEIENITISLSALSETSESSGEVETGLNFSTLLEDNLGSADNLIKNVEFLGIEGYFYAIQPGIDVLDGLSYSSCTIKANYEKDGAAESKTLIEGKEIKLKKSSFDLDTLADNETFTVTASSILDEDNYSATTEENSVCDLFNAMPDNLVIDYELNGFTGADGDTITLNQSEIDALESVKSIQIYILIQVPLRFKLSDKYDYPEENSVNDGYVTISDMRALVYEINDKDMSELDDDLFDRDDEEDWKDEDKRKYLDLIKSAKITYKATNTTNLEIAGQITDALSELDESLSFENSDENKVLELTDDEIQSIFDNYPFIPVIPVRIAADGQEKTISRNGQFGMSGHVTVKVDGEVEIWSK